MIQAYDLRYLPPIPILETWLAIPDSLDWQGPFPAIVDTGADFTIVPQSILREFNAPYLKRAMLRTPWSQKQPVGLYEVDLRVGELVFPAIDVAGDPVSMQVLLGRNVLNRLDLRLEGPNLRTHILGE